MNDVFLELSFVIIVVLLVSLVMRLLRQPLIIGYILSGVLVGPLALGIVNTADNLDVFAHFGVALLLFIIGLKLNPTVIKDVGKTATLTGVAQVLFTTGVGWLIIRALGYSPLIAFYIAIALAFSSTIIVVKLLTDKKEQHRLYAKISVGFLLIQDVCAALLLVVANTLNKGSFSANILLEFFVWGLVLITGLWLMASFILPKLKNIIGGQQEFLFIFAIAWGLGIGALFKHLNFSLEVGSLAAGIALAGQPYVPEIASRLRPLRDFFIIMFFVSLGVGIKLNVLGEIAPEAILLSLFVLIGNPIIVMVIMGILGFTKKTGFKAGLMVAQISEFSLIFIGLIAGTLDQLEDQVVGLVTLIALITIAASSYMIIYADAIYDFMAPFLNIFERQKTKGEHKAIQEVELLLIGYTRGGEQFIEAFKRLKRPYLIVDYNLEIVEHLECNNLPHTYGDISDLELIEELGLENVKLIVSTISDFHANSFLVNYVHNKLKHEIIFICSADTPEQAQTLYKEGADYVMLPHYIGGEQIVRFIEQSGINPQAFTQFRDQHLEHIADLIVKTKQSPKKHLRFKKRAEKFKK